MTDNNLEDIKRELGKSISDFEKWLHTIKKLQSPREYKHFTFPRPSPADWIMQVKGDEVQFNTYIIDKCSVDYLRLVVLHECFHLFVQDVPNKSDAKRLKDDFGAVIMKLLDIEADYYTAMYYKEQRHASLVDIFALYYEGSGIFGDPKIRSPKLERFIGSVLSIANAYFKNPGARATTENDLYLPNISNIPTEDSIDILISKKNYYVLSKINADINDFYKIKKCYTGVSGGGVSSYVQTLLDFACKALNTSLPTAIYRQLHAIDDASRQQKR